MTDLDGLRGKPSRDRPVPWSLRAASRGIWILRRLLGPHRTLDVALDLEWIAHRMAHELAGSGASENYYVAARALSVDLLRAWVPAGSRVLDVGCGRGQWCGAVAPLAAQVVGVDLDADHLSWARQHVDAPNVRFELVDARSLAERGEQFDVILLLHVLEHLDADVEMLRDLRVLAPRLVLEVPDAAGLATNLLREWRDRPAWTDVDHAREYDRATLCASLSEAGWTVLEVEHRWGMLAVLAAAR